MTDYIWVHLDNGWEVRKSHSIFKHIQATIPNGNLWFVDVIFIDIHLVVNYPIRYQGF